MSVHPLHVASINGVDVRFYAYPPADDDEPPWVVFTDLHRAIGLPPEDIPRCMEALRLLPPGEARARMDTPSRPAMIVSHDVAHSFIAGAVSAGNATLRSSQAYGAAFSGAIDALLADLPRDEAIARKQQWLSEG